jgi:hypothetical protein
MVGFHLLRARAVQPGHAIAQRRRRGVNKVCAARRVPGTIRRVLSHQRVLRAPLLIDDVIDGGLLHFPLSGFPVVLG